MFLLNTIVQNVWLRMNAKSPSLPDLKSALKDMMFFEENGHFKDHKVPTWVRELDPGYGFDNPPFCFRFAFKTLAEHIYKMFLRLD